VSEIDDNSEEGRDDCGEGEVLGHLQQNECVITPSSRVKAQCNKGMDCCNMLAFLGPAGVNL
jgi:hypothetical protein